MTGEQVKELKGLVNGILAGLDFEKVDAVADVFRRFQFVTQNERVKRVGYLLHEAETLLEEVHVGLDLEAEVARDVAAAEAIVRVRRRATRPS